jgi:hypothetical protein
VKRSWPGRLSLKNGLSVIFPGWINQSSARS